MYIYFKEVFAFLSVISVKDLGNHRAQWVDVVYLLCEK